jgi:hypothetical protein
VLLEGSPQLVTTTGTEHAELSAAAGAITVMVVELRTVTPPPATPPKVTVEGERKFVPVIVTGVPPEEGPLGGARLTTVGLGKI